jgi:hypothetical protein
VSGHSRVPVTMATHEETPLLTKFERTDVVRHRVNRCAAILGVCATLSVAAYASRGFGASASAGPMKLGDALDDALAELRDLDGSMDDGASVSAAATTSALEPLVLDPPIEGTEAPDGIQDQEQMEDATEFRWTGTEDAPVPEKADDPVLDKYGQPLAADDVDTGVPNTEESVGDGDALGPDSEDAVSEDFKWSGPTRTTDPTTATDQTTTPPMTDASAPAASSIGPDGDETEPDFLHEAPGPFSGAFADVAADGPSAGGDFEDDAADAAAADADDDAADDAVADDDDDADAEDGADGDLTSLEETSAPHTQSTKSVIEDNSSEVQGQVEDNSSEVQEKGDTEISSNAAKVADVPPAGPTSGGAFEDASDAVLDDGWGDDWSDLSTDLDRIKKLAKNLGPSMAPTLVAKYPPAPPRPDLEKRIPKENIITRIDQSQLSFKFSPKFPGKLPKPSVAGNEVAAVAVANVPGFGFSDAQIELVREHKERNAGLPAGSLTVKGFYYAIVEYVFYFPIPGNVRCPVWSAVSTSYHEYKTVTNCI